ncbi:MAG: hypothetical protein FWH20_06015 [Oscillospiraceae bacterium]|nr:hypothetical protein [Oscillospiraceae bacterium]
MRKSRVITAIILAISTALICVSCKTTLDPDRLDFERGFEFEAHLEYGGASSTANFTRLSTGAWSGVLTEPYALQGVQINFSPTEMKVSYSDFAVEYSGVAFVMLNALENAFTKNYTTITGGKSGFEITGTTNDGNYILRLDQNGLPTSLEIAGQNLKVEFANVNAAPFKPAAPTSDFVEIAEASDFVDISELSDFE